MNHPATGIAQSTGALRPQRRSKVTIRRMEVPGTVRIVCSVCSKGSQRSAQRDNLYARMHGLLIDQQTGEVLGRGFDRIPSSREPGAADTDWRTPYTALPMIDGRIVFPFGPPSQMATPWTREWSTMNGPTKAATRAGGLAERIGQPITKLINHWNGDGTGPGPRRTLLFAHSDPEYPLVIEETIEALTLVAVREIESGTYVPHDELCSTFNRIIGPERVDGSGHLRCARSIWSPLDTPATLEELTSALNEWPHIRGAVIAFKSGHRVKIETEEYRKRRTALTTYSQEERVGVLDADEREAVLGELSEPRADRLRAWLAQLDEATATTASQIAAAVQKITAATTDWTEAANAWSDQTTGRPETGPHRTIGLQLIRESLPSLPDLDVRRTALDRVEAWVRRHSGRPKSWELLTRPLLGSLPTWQPPDGDEDE